MESEGLVDLHPLQSLVLTQLPLQASSYASSHNDVPFLLYFASTTPESESRDTRLKTALLLQGSALYDVEKVLARVRAHEKILKVEMAILYGKVRSSVHAYLD